MGEAAGPSSCATEALGVEAGFGRVGKRNSPKSLAAGTSVYYLKLCWASLLVGCSKWQRVVTARKQFELQFP